MVFVPGLAERVVPQRPREDPLLLDERRRSIDPALVGQDDRSSAERLLLKIAIGAATERLYLSYPRMDVAETRARVPSFYALDVMRAITGRVPDHRVLAQRCGRRGWREPRVAGAASIPIAPSTISNTTWRSSSRCSSRVTRSRSRGAPTTCSV